MSRFSRRNLNWKARRRPSKRMLERASLLLRTRREPVAGSLLSVSIDKSVLDRNSLVKLYREIYRARRHLSRF